MDECPVYVGRKTGHPEPQIILRAIGIRPNHAYFQQKDDGFIYLKATEEEALDHILINGGKMNEDPETGIAEHRLFHMDRILFGSNTIFLFKYPLMKRKLDQIKHEIESESQGKVFTSDELIEQAK